MNNNEYSSRDIWDNNDSDPFYDEFWTHVCDYALELGVTTNYVEEEFIIDGELIRHKPKS